MAQLHSFDRDACVRAAAAVLAPAPRGAKCARQATRFLDLGDGPVWSVAASRAGAVGVCVERSRPLCALASTFLEAAGAADVVAVVAGERSDDDDAAAALPTALEGPFDVLLLEPWLA